MQKEGSKANPFICPLSALFCEPDYTSMTLSSPILPVPEEEVQKTPVEFWIVFWFLGHNL